MPSQKAMLKPASWALPKFVEQAAIRGKTGPVLHGRIRCRRQIGGIHITVPRSAIGVVVVPLIPPRHRHPEQPPTT